MISPMTPPGTKVVCINDGICLDIRGVPLETNKLKQGSVYTVAEISRTQAGNIAVRLAEIPLPPGSKGFNIKRFRYVDLPRCLTELLEPVNLPREALV